MAEEIIIIEEEEWANLPPHIKKMREDAFTSAWVSRRMHKKRITAVELDTKPEKRDLAKEYNWEKHRLSIIAKYGIRRPDR